MTSPAGPHDPASTPLHNLIKDTQSASQPNAVRLNRRRFLHGVGAIGASAATLGITACSDDNEGSWPHGNDDQTVTFTHGVASGDPLADRVILWTRVLPVSQGEEIKVNWQIATDEAMTQIVNQGEAIAKAANDHTVKVDADQLTPNTRYYYQFEAQGVKSRVGKTKTLPIGAVSQVKMAVFSCANYPAGYFHAYADAARRNDIDVAIHLGDYIYEYGRTTEVTLEGGQIEQKPAYASAHASELGREVEPPSEITQITDYRRRYAQYRSDQDLQELHANLPMIAVWDDHEFCNDAYKSGAENHQADEGDWEARKLAAMTAYHEWLPTRNSVINDIVRRFDFGDLISLHMLDTRVIGRDEQLNYANYITATGFNGLKFFGDLMSRDRQLLGLKQQNWLAVQLQESKATWQILGQQILMGKMWIPAPILLNFNNPNTGVDAVTYLTLKAKQQQAPDSLSAEEKSILAQPSIPYNLDAWDGYAAARDNLYSLAKANDKNLVVLAGDTHNAWANNLVDNKGDAVGVEFATSSVSSPGFEEYLSDIPPEQFAAALPTLVQGGTLKYTNTSERGYMVVTVTPEACQSEWVFVSDILKPTYSAYVGKTLSVKTGRHAII